MNLYDAIVVVALLIAFCFSLWVVLRYTDEAEIPKRKYLEPKEMTWYSYEEKNNKD